jgi:transcriptional regulator with XRE-family HTH domain
VGRRNRLAKRTATQAAADRQADDLARDLGKALRAARRQRGASQAQAAALAGISPSVWSYLEVGRDGRGTLATWNRAAAAVGSRLKSYLEGVSAADQPRDAVHLRHQELVIRTALSGGWRSLPEEPIDREARTSRAGDVVLERTGEYALAEVWDWFTDVGAAGRDWHRRLDALERYAIARMVGDAPLPRVSGIWVVRATLRNRRLVHDHRSFFASLLPGSGTDWLAALSRSEARMPDEPALLWASVKGDRLLAARLGTGPVAMRVL